MAWQILALGRLANAAAGGLIVLAVGSLAAGLCRQPVRRARLVVLTLLGGVAVPCLGALPVTPRWSAGLLPTQDPARTADREEAPSIATRWPRPVGMLVAEPTPDPGWPSGSVRIPGGAVKHVPARRWSVPTVHLVVTLAYVAATAGLAGWWFIGQVSLWRVTRSARPVPGAVRDAFLALTGPAGERVLVLESDRIVLPFTFTWARPVILLPTSLRDAGEPDALRYVLAHEWSHVERRDAWAWNLACLAGFVLFYQPLFWWLRRQLRLCQDFLADARAAGAGSAEDYAEFLVRLARVRGSGPSLCALGIGDRGSDLSRRVVMLVQEHQPLENRCRTAWSVAVAMTAAVVIVTASGLHLDAAAPPQGRVDAKERNPVPDVAKAPAEPRPAGEALHYTGTVKDKDTGKPIAAATVVVRRSILRSGENRVLQETRHTTDTNGTYTFIIPPEQAADRFLYIELDVEHPDYATRAGFGYALTMIRKNEGLGERPFFETIEMRPAEPITLRVETPEGAPAAGVEVLAYSRTDKVPRGEFEYGSFARTKTDAEGRFRLPITTPGRGVYWVLPGPYAPVMRVLADDRRGDLGALTLKAGVRITGRALDVQGEPLARLLIEARRERGGGPEVEALGQMMVADAVQRTAETDAEGRFTLDPLPPGTYRVMPTEFDSRGGRSAGRVRHDVPGVFAPMSLTLKEGESPAPLEVRASPHVVIEGQWLDSKGQPRSGWESFVHGRIGGVFWTGLARPDTRGKFSLMVPRGLEDARLNISTNEHASARHRVGKYGPLAASRDLRLGTLDHDVKGIEIVRYDAPIVVVNATTRDGRQIEGFKATVVYTEPGPNSEAKVHLMGGTRSEAIQDEQNDGRYRTSQLLPDREVNVSVTAEGFATASRTLKLPEGKTEEVTFVLDPR